MADEHTQKLAQEAMEEARVVLPGIQALFGFQLIAVFNERFTHLPEEHQLLHLTAAVLVALAIALIMTPAAYHRQVEPDSASRSFVMLTSKLIMYAMVPLTLALCMEIYLLATLIAATRPWSLALAVALAAVFVGLWFVFPLACRRKERKRDHA
jgi:hypothetical protein